MVGDAGPIGGFAKERGDVRKAQLAKDAQGKDLAIRFGQGMNERVQVLCILRADQPGLGRGLRVGLRRELQGIRVLFPIGKIGVFRDLAQPHADGALAAEAIDGAKHLEKRFAGELLGERRIAAQAAQIPVDVREIGLKDLVKMLQSLTSRLYDTHARVFLHTGQKLARGIV